jgi:hypothetical protein
MRRASPFLTGEKRGMSVISGVGVKLTPTPLFDPFACFLCLHAFGQAKENPAEAGFSLEV